MTIEQVQSVDINSLTDEQLYEFYWRLIECLEKAHDLDSADGAMTLDEMVVFSQMVFNIENTGRVNTYEGKLNKQCEAS